MAAVILLSIALLFFALAAWDYRKTGRLSLAGKIRLRVAIIFSAVVLALYLFRLV